MSADTPKVIFTKIKEDVNGKIWKVDAIHATTTRNGREYTKEELMQAARGLSMRPIDINHDESRYLPYDFKNPIGPNSNSTIIMGWSAEKSAVVGSLWISDSYINKRIEAGEIQTVSIEQVPVDGQTCSCSKDACKCEQHGVVFLGIAILETAQGVQPGDPNAFIKPNVEAAAAADMKCPKCGKTMDSQDAMDAHMKSAHTAANDNDGDEKNKKAEANDCHDPDNGQFCGGDAALNTPDSPINDHFRGGKTFTTTRADDSGDIIKDVYHTSRYKDGTVGTTKIAYFSKNHGVFVANIHANRGFGNFLKDRVKFDNNETLSPTNREADYPWDQCIADQKNKGYDDETAKKICGSIKAANELKQGCGCSEKKALIEELAKLERFLITGKLE